MKKTTAASFATASLLVLFAAATAQARVDVNLNIGVPVPVAPAPAPPVAVYPVESPWPVGQPEVVIDEPPRFIFSPNLGFYVSIGIPYDVVYVDNSYFLYRGGYWYRSPSYRGPWNVMTYRRLPHALRDHRYEQIRYYRDYEYRTYMHDRDRYRGRWYQPPRVRGVEYRDGRGERWKDRHDGRWDHGDRGRGHDDRGWGHGDRGRDHGDRGRDHDRR